MARASAMRCIVIALVPVVPGEIFLKVIRQHYRRTGDGGGTHIANSVGTICDRSPRRPGAGQRMLRSDPDYAQACAGKRRFEPRHRSQSARPAIRVATCSTEGAMGPAGAPTGEQLERDVPTYQTSRLIERLDSSVRPLFRKPMSSTITPRSQTARP